MLKKSRFLTTQFGFVFCVLEPLLEVRECSGGWGRELYLQDIVWESELHWHFWSIKYRLLDIFVFWDKVLRPVWYHVRLVRLVGLVWSWLACSLARASVVARNFVYVSVFSFSESIKTRWFLWVHLSSWNKIVQLKIAVLAFECSCGVLCVPSFFIDLLFQKRNARVICYSNE